MSASVDAESLGDRDTTPPTSLGFAVHADSEDANNIYYNLHEYFHDNLDPSLQYSVIANTNPGLFDSVTIHSVFEGSKLALDVAADATGEARITIRATDDAGNFVDDTLTVVLLPVNDRPTTKGFSNINVQSGVESTVIDLFAMFDDVEDADNELTYSITQNSNPALFRSIVIDANRGTMTFNYAPQRTGSSEITIRATDTEGLSVEMATTGANFPIYDWLFGQPGRHYPDVKLQGMGLAANHWLFPFVNGHYQFDHLDEAQLRRFLRERPENSPFVFNIENDYYDNTPEGRDRFAEIFSIVMDERPDLVSHFGVYRIMPENSWFLPLDAYRAVEDVSRDVNTYYSINHDLFLQHDAIWKARNDLFLTEPVSPRFGGMPLANMVGMMIPSLYTFYRNDPAILNSMLMQVRLNVSSNRLTALDNVVYDGMPVRLVPSNNAHLPGGLTVSQSYFVVNTNGSEFQLALSPDSDPVKMTGITSGNVYLATQNHQFMLHDPAVHYWEQYARANISEARQYNHPVLPWLSPSKEGVGAEYIDKNFFRMQLDLAFELSDGVGLYDEATPAGANPANRGWWGALEEFIEYLHSPTQFTVSIGSDVESELITTSRSANVAINTGIGSSTPAPLPENIDITSRSALQSTGATAKVPLFTQSIPLAVGQALVTLRDRFRSISLASHHRVTRVPTHDAATSPDQGDLALEEEVKGLRTDLQQPVTNRHHHGH